MNNISTYFIALATFLVIDGLWLGLVAKNFYKNQIGHLMGSSVNWPAALIFYAFYIVALVYFVISPGIKSGDVKGIVIGAIMFGLVTYATYDLTNQATLKDWPYLVTIVDLAWGAFVCTAVSLVTYYIVTKFI